MDSRPAENGTNAPLAVSMGLPLFCILVTTVYLGVCLDPFMPVKNYVLRLAVTAGLLGWLYKGIASGRILVVRTSLDLRIGALVLWTGLTGVWAINRPLWEHDWTMLLCGAALYYMVVFYFNTTEKIMKLIGFMIAPVFVMFPLGAADLFNKSFFPWDRLIVNRFVNIFDYIGVLGQLPPGWGNSFYGRVSTTFGNPVYLAGWLVLMIPVAWVYYREAKTLGRRLYAMSALLMMLALLTASFTRSGWLSALIAAGIMTVLSRGRGRAPSSSAPGLIVIAIACLLLFIAFATRSCVINQSYFGIKERIQTMRNLKKDDSTLERTLIWKTCVEMITDKPLQGVGFGNYQVQHPLYQIPFFQDDDWKKHHSFPERVHNEYLDMWAETGAVGLAFMLLLISGAARAGFLALKRQGREARLAAGMMSGAAALLIYANAQFPLHNVAAAAFLWIFAGMLTVLGEGDGLRRKELVLRQEPRPREGLLAGISLTALFLLCAWNFTKPIVGNAAYQWGLFAAPAATDELESAKRAMEMGMDQEPGNLEMPVRYASSLFTAASRVEGTGFREYLYREALEESLRGLSYHPYESRLYLNAGNAYMKLGQPGPAIKMLEKAVVFNPMQPAAFYNLGIAQYLTGLYNNATINYYRALDLDKNLPGLHLNLGMACLRSGLYPQALDAFNSVIKVQGESKEIHNSLGRVHSEMGQRELAVSHYRRALALAPDYSEARGNLAIGLLDTGNPTEAAELLEKVIEAQPDSGIAHYHLGRAYHQLGRDSEAAAQLEKALSLMPDHRDSRKLLETVSGGNKNK